MSVIFKCSYEARVFVLDKPFVTSLVFVGEAYLSEAPCEAPFGYSFLGKLRLGWKVMLSKNTQAS